MVFKASTVCLLRSWKLNKTFCNQSLILCIYYILAVEKTKRLNFTEMSMKYSSHNGAWMAESQAGCAECLWGAPSSGRLGQRGLFVSSQLHCITCLHPPPEWPGLSLPLLIQATAVKSLHQHLPSLLAAAAEEELVLERWRVQNLWAALSLWVTLM